MRSWYETSFSLLRSCEVPRDAEREEAFARVLESIYERHSSTLMTMAKGAHEIKTMLKHDVASFAALSELQYRIDKFYKSRINIRILIGQYLALRKAANNPGTIGLIDLKASPYDIAKQAIEDAAYVCDRTHGDSPCVTVHGRTDLTFPYVSSHIHYMLLELLKNNMRATVEHHGLDDMPPIRVVIADREENEDVSC